MKQFTVLLIWVPCLAAFACGGVNSAEPEERDSAAVGASVDATSQDGASTPDAALTSSAMSGIEDATIPEDDSSSSEAASMDASTPDGLTANFASDAAFDAQDSAVLEEAGDSSAGADVDASPADGATVGADGSVDSGGDGATADAGEVSTEGYIASPQAQGSFSFPLQLPGSVSPEYDGTVGLPCQSDADCRPPGGPGVNSCSLSAFPDPIFPTPVCVLTTCNPGTDGNVHYCDGFDDSPVSSSGVCIPTGASAEGGIPQGICLPQCFWFSGGSPPLPELFPVLVDLDGGGFGCAGNDACNFWASVGGVLGIGYCWGGCTIDSECPAGSSCQMNEGICVDTPVPPSTLGAPCTSADNVLATNAAPCDCLANPSTMAGVCSQFCVVDSMSAVCPAGYVCDALEPSQVSDPDGGVSPAFTVQNTGLAGYCLESCGEDAGSCPANLTCSTATAAGPDCTP
ncbi:MAG: hypothetical protein ABSF69_18200 [Polyangiaceae bacterium]